MNKINNIESIQGQNDSLRAEKGLGKGDRQFGGVIDQEIPPELMSTKQLVQEAIAIARDAVEVAQYLHERFVENRSTVYPAAGGAIDQLRISPLHSRTSQRAATFEAAKIVVAWALGKEFSIAEINRKWETNDKSVSYSYTRFDEGSGRGANKRSVDFIKVCAISYAGSVACARKSHKAFKRVFATYGQRDAICNELIFSGLPSHLIREEIEVSALATARAICTKYVLLLNAVEAVLLENSKIEQQEFSQLLTSKGFATGGGEFYAAQ